MENKDNSTSMIGFRCPNDLKEKLQSIADSEGRSLSNLIVKILKENSGNK